MKQKTNDELLSLRKKIKTFPATPGLYFMKAASDKVLYIGKAKNLRSRAASYFQPAGNIASSRGPKILEMLNKVKTVDFLETKNEVDAVLAEARLIKDIKPPYNTVLADGKSFPYLEITTSDDFPAVYVTRKPRPKGTRLFGPFTNAKDLRQTVVLLQKIFQFRTCKLSISSDDKKRRFFRPCLLFSIKQCTAPCADKISKTEYKKTIRELTKFLRSKRSVILRDLKKQMTETSDKQEYKKAAQIRDRIRLIERLDRQGSPTENLQPEVFAADPAEALEKLTKKINSAEPVRIIEGIDVANIAGKQTVGALVKFIDGRPFKDGYRRFKIKTVKGIDDYAMIAEIIKRRYKYALRDQEIWPDLILIDGGKGHLNAAQNALKKMNAPDVKIASIAKKEEKIFLQGKEKPLKLSRNSPALKLLQYVRDEAHRFAQHYFHILRNKNMLGQEK